MTEGEVRDGACFCDLKEKIEKEKYWA